MLYKHFIDLRSFHSTIKYTTSLTIKWEETFYATDSNHWTTKLTTNGFMSRWTVSKLSAKTYYSNHINHANLKLPIIVFGNQQ